MMVSNKQVSFVFLVTAAAVAKLNDAAGKFCVPTYFCCINGRSAAYHTSHYNTHTTHPDS